MYLVIETKDKDNKICKFYIGLNHQDVSDDIIFMVNYLRQCSSAHVYKVYFNSHH